MRLWLETCFRPTCKKNGKKNMVELVKEHLTKNIMIKEPFYKYPRHEHFYKVSERFAIPDNVYGDAIGLIYNFVYDIGTRSSQLAVFDIADDLAKYLDFSDYKDIPGKMFRLPMDNMLIRIPKGILVSDGYDYTELYVQEYKEEHVVAADGKLFKIWFYGKDIATNEYGKIKYVWLPVPTNTNIKELYDTDEFKTNWYKNSIEDAMRINSISKEKATDLILDDYKLLENGWMYVVKVILYLNTQKKDVVKLSSIKKSPMDSFTVFTRESYDVGKNIIIDSRIKVVYDDYRDSGRKMTCPKWLVRGHMRKYAHMEEMIWIEPYYKGEKRDDESILEVGKNYILKTTE